MADVVPFLKLTYEGARKMLAAAIAKADAMGVPQCVAIVDNGGNLLAFARMDGAKPLSVDSATRKAISAASSRAPTGGMAEGLDIRLAIATQGKLLNVKGGLPVIVDGHTNQSIARSLGISEKTVKTHCSRLFQRLGVTDRTQAAVWAMRNLPNSGGQ